MFWEFLFFLIVCIRKLMFWLELLWLKWEKRYCVVCIIDCMLCIIILYWFILINKFIFYLFFFLECFKDLVVGMCKSLLVYVYKIYIYIFLFVDNIVDIYWFLRLCVLIGKENIYICKLFLFLGFFVFVKLFFMGGKRVFNNSSD